jgi:hypothetical protein
MKAVSIESHVQRGLFEAKGSPAKLLKIIDGWHKKADIFPKYKKKYLSIATRLEKEIVSVEESCSCKDGREHDQKRIDNCLKFAWDRESDGRPWRVPEWLNRAAHTCVACGGFGKIKRVTLRKARAL